MGAFDGMDTDNDGSAMDDLFGMGTEVAGAGLIGLGGLGAAAGTGIASLGGAAMAIGAMESGTVLGIPAGAATAGVGAGMVAAGSLLGLGSVGMAGLGGVMSTDAAGVVAEEVGDFTADLFGTRGEPPYEGEIGDPHYKEGQTDLGLGQQLHDAIFGKDPAIEDSMPIRVPVSPPTIRP